MAVTKMINSNNNNNNGDNNNKNSSNNNNNDTNYKQPQMNLRFILEQTNGRIEVSIVVKEGQWLPMDNLEELNQERQ